MNIAETREAVHQLLQEHNLFNQGWRFKLSRGKRRLGSCHGRDKTVRISQYLISMGTDEEIMETVRHEVAHAIVGPGKGHDNEWKTAAWRIGANPQARVSKLSYSIPHKYEVKCGVCSRVLQKRHRGINPHRLSNHYCRRCGRERSLGRIYLTLA